MITNLDFPKVSKLTIIFDLLKEAKWPVLEYLYLQFGETSNIKLEKVHLDHFTAWYSDTTWLWETSYFQLRKGYFIKLGRKLHGLDMSP